MGLFKKIFRRLGGQSNLACDNVSSQKSCPGKFYVDCQCLDHDLCRITAPTLFERDEDLAVLYVKKQPETAEEAELMKECVEGCPVEAIKEDGESLVWSDFKNDET